MHRATLKYYRQVAVREGWTMRHLELWQRILNERSHAGSEWFTITPEFTPPLHAL